MTTASLNERPACLERTPNSRPTAKSPGESASARRAPRTKPCAVKGTAEGSPVWPGWPANLLARYGQLTLEDRERERAQREHLVVECGEGEPPASTLRGSSAPLLDSVLTEARRK